MPKLNETSRKRHGIDVLTYWKNLAENVNQIKNFYPGCLYLEDDHPGPQEMRFLIPPFDPSLVE